MVKFSINKFTLWLYYIWAFIEGIKITSRSRQIVSAIRLILTSWFKIRKEWCEGIEQAWYAKSYIIVIKTRCQFSIWKSIRLVCDANRFLLIPQKGRMQYLVCITYLDYFKFKYYYGAIFYMLQKTSTEGKFFL